MKNVMTILMMVVVIGMLVGPANAGTIIHYEFEGDCIDSSGNGYDGVASSRAGTPVLPTYTSGNGGKFGEGIVLDSSSYQWVDIDDSDLPNFHPRTVMVWAKLTEPADDGKEDFIFGTMRDYRVFIMVEDGGDATTNGTAKACVGTSYSPFGTKTNVAMDGNTWVHFALVLEEVDVTGLTAKFYVNGDLAGTKTGLTRHSDTSLAGANVGSYANGAMVSGGDLNFAHGTLDDFAIFDSALTETQIEGYMANGVPEPATMTLLLLGLPLALRRRR